MHYKPTGNVHRINADQKKNQVSSEPALLPKNKGWGAWSKKVTAHPERERVSQGESKVQYTQGVLPKLHH